MRVLIVAALIASALPGCAPTSTARAWLAGENGLVRSDDGGATWHRMGGSPEGLRSLMFVNRQAGYAAADTVWVTTDGGESYSDFGDRIDIGAAIHSRFVSFSGGPGGHMIAVGWFGNGAHDLVGQPIAIFSLDGGNSFTESTIDLGMAVDSTFGAELSSGCINQDGVAFATGQNGSSRVVLRSADGGASWDNVEASIPLEGTWTGVACRGDHFWLAGSGPSFLIHTGNAGTDWDDESPNAPAGPYGLNAVQLLDDSRGWAVGSDPQFGPVILRTDDGGGHWARQAAPGPALLRAVAVADTTSVMAIGDDGGTLDAAHPVALYTADGGATWSTSPAPAWLGLLRAVAETSLDPAP